ncbi:NADH:flavin oxidoreductase/NADH oxidase [bacterium]|nr:NADH:flavin oxidoreductase/NADH oxidase [bacterium]
MLFDPFFLRGMHLKNRIIMAPMCQYSAGEDGFPQSWHEIHYVSRAVGQVGAIILEATAVEPRGRISNKDLGLWSDNHIKPLAQIIEKCQSYGCKVGIQISHAGRKADIFNEPIVAPSPVRFNNKYQLPEELDHAEIEKIIDAFSAAVQRADLTGADFIEIHAAHGYLINQFLSPLSNLRTDEYGQNRSLFLQQILERARRQLSSDKPISVRISAEDYKAGGNHPENFGELLNPIKSLIDIVHVSSGGVVDDTEIPAFPGYQVKFSEIIRQQLKLPTIAVGKLDSPILAEEILQNKRADLIALGRELLRNPYWVLRTSSELKSSIDWPIQYLRAQHNIG